MNPIESDKIMDDKLDLYFRWGFSLFWMVITLIGIGSVSLFIGHFSQESVIPALIALHMSRSFWSAWDWDKRREEAK